MVLLIAMIGLGQVKAGPSDAFRANHGSIHARLDFTYRIGQADKNIVGGKLWEPGDVAIVESLAQGMQGSWECDGTVEHIIVIPTPEAAKLRPVPKVPGEIIPGAIPLEQVADGEVAAYHPIGKGNFGAPLNLKVGEDSRLVHHGPFHFNGEDFAYNLKRVLHDMPPTFSKSGLRDGRPCDIAIYRVERNGKLHDSWEIAYDPSIGYLPRFTREMNRKWQQDGGPMHVTETYLADAKACSAGGFVPTAWSTVKFRVDDFEGRYPNYTDDANLEPSQSQVSVQLFRATNFSDLTGPAKLVLLEGVKEVWGIGGIVPLRNSPKTLALAEAKSLLGRKLTEQRAVVLPNIDQAELHEFDGPAGRFTWAYYTLAATALVAIALLVWSRRRGALSVTTILAIALGGGCGPGAAPVFKLTGAFDRTRFIYDARDPAVSLTMILRNEGSIPMRVLDVNGGCACRQVEKSSLPTTIAPGRNLRLGISMSTDKGFEATSIGFKVATDQGTFDVPLAIHALPNHHFSPSSVTLGSLIEGRDGQFEITHREVFPSDKGIAGGDLKFPEGLKGQAVDHRRGRVGGAPEFSYRDTTYRVDVVDPTKGLRRADIALEGGGQEGRMAIPVVWRRVDYLTSVPDRVVLGMQPVRVFLKCPDQEVELSRVLSAPAGVKAFAVSPRELTVQLLDDAPGIVEGSIEVGTTSPGRPPLKIPVVRYAPAVGHVTASGPASR